MDKRSPTCRNTTLRQPFSAWYDNHRRDLPWRAGPGRALRSLSGLAVARSCCSRPRSPRSALFSWRFLSRWPTLEALAAASLDDVLSAWAGLGYYARARNLHRCARASSSIMAAAFPRMRAALAKLPGIGRYTAGAIAAIAFDSRLPPSTAMSSGS